uniref:Uncharacterized protein n=1 Tax=Anopheles albimanus TaxID=7167 RepID=A0A182F2N6_ANOAL
MSQLVADVVPSVVEKVESESEILVENKLEQSSEATIVKKEEGHKKRSLVEKILLRKSNNPPVPPKVAKKSKQILENKPEVEIDQKFMPQKLEEKIDENLQAKQVAKTESTVNLVDVSEKMLESGCPSIPQIKGTQDFNGSDNLSENEIPKQDLTEHRVDASVIVENPMEMQVDPSRATSTALPTPVVPYVNEAKIQKGSRKDTRTPSFTNLSRISSASSSTSRSSLGISAAPSNSSMCHLTELSQPTMVHLQSTLAQLRRLNANTERVQQHLRDLRNRPTLARRANKSSSDTRINQSSQTQTGSKSLAATRISWLSVKTEKCDLLDGLVYEKLADRLFETLETKLTVKNAAEYLLLPMESDYYRAAYAGLARIWGQPYTKCSLELHQHLAAELGLLAETFVMESTRGMSLDTLQKQTNDTHFTT